MSEQLEADLELLKEFLSEVTTERSQAWCAGCSACG